MASKTEITEKIYSVMCDYSGRNYDLSSSSAEDMLRSFVKLFLPGSTLEAFLGSQALLVICYCLDHLITDSLRLGGELTPHHHPLDRPISSEAAHQIPRQPPQPGHQQHRREGVVK
jgi:hypothetical protein